MTLLSTLFTYRQRPNHSPLENFLTEALCRLLQLLDEAELSADAIKRLLALDPPAGRVRLEWTSQFRLRSDDESIDGLLPDLIGEGFTSEGGVLLVLENKVAAGFTERFDDRDGATKSQLECYQSYIQKRQPKYEELILLTHLTAAPTGWDGHVRYSSDLHRELDDWVRTGELKRHKVAEWYAGEFLEFLKENGMGKVELSITEIASYPLWSELQNKCTELGQMRRFFDGSHTAKRMNEAGFFRSQGKDEFVPPCFFGDVVLTPVDADSGKAVKVAEACVVFWIGIIVDSIYELVPSVQGVPEFNAGFVLWVYREQVAQEGSEKRLGNIQEKLGQKWSIARSPQPGYEDSSDVWIISRSEGFLGLVGNSSDWQMRSKEFYDQAISDLEKLSAEDLRFLASWQAKEKDWDDKDDD
jgi:hypothetical protein